jgi:hypothetical protein
MTAITIPHLHLLLNHVPTVGLAAGVGLLLLALVRKNDDLLRASCEVLFAIALLTLPVYLTGSAAEQAIEDIEGVAVPAIKAHELAALWAFLAMQFTGLAAWIALWQSRRAARPPRKSVGVVLLSSVLTMAMMARAATIGGEIRHPEILSNPEAVAVGVPTGWFTPASIAHVTTTYPWVWPAAECLHFLGLALTFGILLAVNLRILGMMKGLSFASLHRLLPWGILGFGMNLVTGMMFFIAASTQYTDNVAFYWKVLFLGIAGAHFLYLTVLDTTWTLKAGENAGIFQKAIAAVAIASWVGVIYWGRMLPFIGNAF